MIVVRMVFHMHPGRAPMMVEGLKQNVERMAPVFGDDVVRTRILTDLSGPFDTVIQEYELPSLAVWEALRTRMFSSEEWQAAMAEARERYGDTPMMREGGTEFYTLEASFE